MSTTIMLPAAGAVSGTHSSSYRALATRRANDLGMVGVVATRGVPSAAPVAAAGKRSRPPRAEPR